MNSFFNPRQFASLLQHRELCALYILGSHDNQPQNLQLFETYINESKNQWVILPTPVSSFKFFQSQWRNNYSAHEVLTALHRHKSFGPQKQLLVDSARGITYAFIPNLGKYIKG